MAARNAGLQRRDHPEVADIAGVDLRKRAEARVRVVAGGDPPFAVRQRSDQADIRLRALDREGGDGPFPLVAEGLVLLAASQRDSERDHHD